MTELLKTTPLIKKHEEADARLVDFSGWRMPVQYPTGIIQEHLATRLTGGLFDVSHMGRFLISGPDALAFCRHALTNDAALLAPGQSQYTLLADTDGTAIDDAYLYRPSETEFLLVVNAGNLSKDWRHLRALSDDFTVSLTDISVETAMIAVQGPVSGQALARVFAGQPLPSARNEVSRALYQGHTAQVSRTGYTGEPIAFEIILPAERAEAFWDECVRQGVIPVGLGARDTLRLEAGLPLYGHEFGTAPDGTPIPIFTSPLARFGVKLSADRPDFFGGGALAEQVASPPHRVIRPFSVTGKGIARAGCEVYHQGQPVGWVTSGTMVPYWKTPGAAEDGHATRALGLAWVNRSIVPGDAIECDVRGKMIPGVIAKTHLNNRRPPFAIPVLSDENP
ncbi:MAG: glycine cleavage system aminomethyltransferase GcvT [Lentisphaeria bacterium]|nr:glycine cleavage system aminomethyltransferase GcvT [Lentisphaeria bacterium]